MPINPPEWLIGKWKTLGPYKPAEDLGPVYKKIWEPDKELIITNSDIIFDGESLLEEGLKERVLENIYSLIKEEKIYYLSISFNNRKTVNDELLFGKYPENVIDFFYSRTRFKVCSTFSGKIERMSK